MTDSLRFTVPGKPQPKERPRLGPNGRVYTPRRTTSFESTVGVYALAAVRRSKWTLAPKSAQFAVEISAYFPDLRRRDVDNVMKAVLDAMNAVVWADDVQVTRATIERRLDTGNPRVEVTVVRLGCQV